MQTLQPHDAHTGQAAGEVFSASTPENVDTAVRAAHACAAEWGASTGATRAALLRELASALESDREALVPLADQETALGAARLNVELDRTAFQLRRFATLAEDGLPYRVVDDPAVAGAPPAGHPDMRLQRVPLGPVAMFAASNFPFAFSVLGGDTASALAAGCPVVVKAHPGHPALSRHVHALAQTALRRLGLPGGLIGLVEGAGVEVGVELVRHPLIAAGAFTGSTRGGLALEAQARSRARPIPFYGELGAINPVVVLPQALQGQSEAAAQMLAGSITLGCGQFCTNPGLLVLIDGPQTQAFIQHLSDQLAPLQPHEMLTQHMKTAFEQGVKSHLAAGARALLQAPGKGAAPGPQLLAVDAARFIQEPALHEEVFGPCSLIVLAKDVAQVLNVLQAVGGSLTATLWGADEDTADNRALVRQATAIAGRVLFKGVPTGVAVTAAQHHGGPWPASTAPMTTSVGDAAIDRFLRPVCLQDAPAWMVTRGGVPC